MEVQKLSALLPYTNDSVQPLKILIAFSIAGLAIFWLLQGLTGNGKKANPPLPPGPRGLPVVGNLFSLDPQFHSFLAKLSQIYGPIITLKLGKKICIVINSPALAREVLKDHDAVFANREELAVNAAVPYGGRNIAFSQYGPEWRMLRKVTAEGMLGRAALDKVCSIRRREMRSTVAHLYSQAGSPVNLNDHMFLAALNLTMNTLWGGTVKGKERKVIAEEFRNAIRGVTEVTAMPNISDFFPVLAPFDLQGMKKKMRESVLRLEQVNNVIIGKRQKMNAETREEEDESDGEPEDFLQYLLQLEDKGDPKTPLEMIHVKALLMDMVVGGTDTCSNTVEFAMALMMDRPLVMKKLQQELDSVVGKSRMVEESDIWQLPYLQAVMKEVLRLHPPVPLMVPHCPSESCVIGGYTVPKGARVLINGWAIQRDPSLWENPLEFDPDRFLNGKGDYSGNDFTYIPFGSGRRICPGVEFAERMLMYPIASLVHSFDWKLPAGEKLEFSEIFGIVLKKKAPLLAIPTPRLAESAYELIK